MISGKVKETRNLFRIGAAFLLLANLSRWFVHPSADLTQGIVDAAIGVLFGLAIGFMLLAVILKSRRQRNGGDSACAS